MRRLMAPAELAARPSFAAGWFSAVVMRVVESLAEVFSSADDCSGVLKEERIDSLQCLCFERGLWRCWTLVDEAASLADQRLGGWGRLPLEEVDVAALRRSLLEMKRPQIYWSLLALVQCLSHFLHYGRPG